MPKTAIVYDWMDKWGGVERVLIHLHNMFPGADFYTSYYDDKNASWARDFKVYTSFLQNFPDFIRKSRLMSLIFYPFAFESFNFSDYDLVISVSSSFAKAIITKPKTRHISYLLTPTRFLWSHKKDYFTQNLLTGSYISYLQKWDYIAGQRPDKIIAISETVRRRIKKYYKRDSEVVYPGFDFAYWQKIKFQILNNKSQINSKYKILNTKYFLIVSRLESYKKIDLAIKVFNKINQPLIIVGEGSDEKKLKSMAGKNITFLAKLSDIDLGFLYSKAKALIMPQEEDYGYVALESQFFGCPVIAYKKGGATETVVENQTGIFFGEQTGSALRLAIERFDKIEYTLRVGFKISALKNLERFDKNKFGKEFVKYL